MRVRCIISVFNFPEYETRDRSVPCQVSIHLSLRPPSALSDHPEHKPEEGKMLASWQTGAGITYMIEVILALLGAKIELSRFGY
jgi:hypothetical protein